MACPKLLWTVTLSKASSHTVSPPSSTPTFQRASHSVAHPRTLSLSAGASRLTYAGPTSPLSYIPRPSACKSCTSLLSYTPRPSSCKSCTSLVSYTPRPSSCTSCTSPTSSSLSSMRCHCASNPLLALLESSMPDFPGVQSWKYSASISHADEVTTSSFSSEVIKEKVGASRTGLPGRLEGSSRGFDEATGLALLRTSLVMAPCKRFAMLVRPPSRAQRKMV
mmetsp:Transcript_30069/g.64010  ORF Transcript_30069/g.64010 Transcript_30069/m.64010 type:complete len:222 (-) Transcript_30069:159-824(-)